jgi:hypothetical protein
VRRRKTTQDKIASEFAKAITLGEFERAEGWFAVARFAAEREADRPRQSRATQKAPR